MQEDFDRPKNNWAGSVFKPIFQQIHDIKHFFLASRVILWAEVKHDSLAPLIEIFNPVQQRDDKLLCDIDTTFISGDLVDCINSINDNQAILVIQQIINLL